MRSLSPCRSVSKVQHTQEPPARLGRILRRSGAISALLVAALGSSVVAQGGANLLQDGGFEGFGIAAGAASYQASYGAWTSVQGATALIGTPYGTVPVYEGGAAMHVGNGFGAGYVEQTFPTTIGTSYRLSFAAVGWAGGATSVQATVSGTGGTAIFSNCAAPGGNVWLKHDLTFVASSSSSVLRLQNASGAGTIDDVRCATADLVQDGGFEGFGTVPGGPYLYQTSFGAWTAGGNPGCAAFGLPTGSSLPYEGSAAMYIGGSFNPNYIEQTLVTTVGAQYTLSLGINGGPWISSANATVSGSGGLALSTTFDAPTTPHAWGTVSATFTATSSLSTLRIENATGGSHIDDVRCLLQAVPEIELRYTTASHLTWNDVGSGANLDGSFWAPNISAGTGAIKRLVHAARRGYTAPAGMVVAEDLTGTALAQPVSYTTIWTDSGSGANGNGCFFQPVPPAGYVSLGIMGTNCATTYGVYCVRQDLCVQGTIGNMIWNDSGSGANSDFSAWKIVAPPGAIDVGGYVGHASHGVPGTTVWCLRADAVSQLDAPTPAQLASAISDHGPILQLHSSESFLPDDPDFVLNAPGTLVVAELVNQGYSTFNEQFLSGTTVGTSAATILNDVQPSLSHALTGDPEFLYRLNYSQSLAGGSLSRAKSYVRVQPIDSLITELQFWVFYPWNGPGKSEAGCGSLPTVVFNPTGANGSHFSDWENVRVRVTNKSLQNPGNYELVSVVMSRHSTEEEVAAANLIYAIGRPVIYVAKDSHAQYPSPGTHYYERVASTNIGICTAYVDLFDLTDGNNANQLHCYQSSKYQVVSSAWPSVPTSTPDWFFFGGQWGGFGLHSFTVTAFGQTLHTETEVANGKPGLLRRNEFAVPIAKNANLGRLLTSVGSLSPAFVPQTPYYSLTVPSSTSTIDLTALAEDHNAVVSIEVDGANYPVASGGLYGLSNALPLTYGLNVCEITVAVAGAVSTYHVDITREFVVLEHSCGPVTISVSADSSARLGGHIETTISNYGGGIPLIGYGFLPSAPFCGCTIGHNWLVAYVGNTSTLPMGTDPALIGFQFAIQGDGFLTPGGCASPTIAMTDTILVTIGQ
jgi:hypothetical protein